MEAYKLRIVILLMVLAITPSASLAEVVEGEGEPMSSETELRYFDVTTLKYGEEPDLGIPEEYKVPVEAAFELAKMFRVGRQDFDTGGEFTRDYIIAYDLANGYYEYGFLYVDPLEGGIDLEYISKQAYELAELGKAEVKEVSSETGTFAWLCSEGKQREFETLGSDATYKGYTKGAVKRVHFVPADKRGEFAVHQNTKRGIPDPIGFLRYALDETAAEVLGPGEVTEVTLSSNPGTGHMVVIYEINEKYIYFERYAGYNYYILGDFRSAGFASTDFYRHRLKGFVDDTDIDSNVNRWNGFIKGLSLYEFEMEGSLMETGMSFRDQFTL